MPRKTRTNFEAFATVIDNDFYSDKGNDIGHIISVVPDMLHRRWQALAINIIDRKKVVVK
ncbi:MAG: hypothetical protein IKH01_05965 [Prevotella sp.]|nr:hypothetical protein [Prevotella sp.]